MKLGRSHLREERGLRVFESSVLRGIMGSMGEKRSLLVIQNFSDDEKNEISWACMGERRGEVYTEFWWGGLRERDHLGGPDLDGRIILRWIFRK